jgi:hypothetical protein
VAHEPVEYVNVVIIADCLGVYAVGLNHPLSALIPSTTMPLINALL